MKKKKIDWSPFDENYLIFSRKTSDGSKYVQIEKLHTKNLHPDSILSEPRNPKVSRRK